MILSPVLSVKASFLRNSGKFMENETTRYIFVYPEGGFIQQHIAVTSACHNMDDQQRFCDALEAPLILDSENHPSHDGVFGSF
ncbi:hypothetical protein ACQJBY_030307 [Aegilops geniculata]